MIITVSDPCRPLQLESDKPLEIEVGCGKGRFLTGRAARNPAAQFLGIERMMGRVNSFDDKCKHLHLANAHVLRLEALYTFWYLLPAHAARRVYVFFPDPWPKKKHHSHRLFGPLFLKALWKRLEIGGRIEFATDHEEYFRYVTEECEWDARRYRRVDPMVRGEDEWTEFETRFRKRGMPIFSAAWETVNGEDYELEPMKVPPEDEPREGIMRRIGKRYLPDGVEENEL